MGRIVCRAISDASPSRPGDCATDQRGRDLGREAQRAASAADPASRLAAAVEVTAPNNRVVLHYQSTERRCERMAGGVPGWTWTELGPMVRDPRRGVCQLHFGLRAVPWDRAGAAPGIPGPLYADFHSLFLGMQQDGMRVLQPLPQASDGLHASTSCSLNEDEMRQLSPDSAQPVGPGAPERRFEGWCRLRSQGSRLRGRARVRWTGGRAPGGRPDVREGVRSRRWEGQPSDRPTVRPSVPR